MKPGAAGNGNGNGGGNGNGKCHAIPVMVGPLVSTKRQRPCPLYFDVTFLEDGAAATSPRPMWAIAFRNYYCDHITVKQKRGVEWDVVLDRRRLMSSPHHEGDAQYWHVIRASELSAPFSPTLRATLRFYLHQPSPLWKRIELQHLKCVWREEVNDTATEEARCLGEGTGFDQGVNRTPLPSLAAELGAALADVARCK